MPDAPRDDPAQLTTDRELVSALVIRRGLWWVLGECSRCAMEYDAAHAVLHRQWVQKKTAPDGA